MHALTRRLINGLHFRAQRYELGLWSPFRHLPPSHPPRIAGRRVPLSFPDSERAVHEHEFSRIFFDDSYQLKAGTGQVNTVLDIGANVGLFSLAARHRYRKAVIHAYEPNPALKPHLDANTRGFNIGCRLEAVGSISGRVSFDFGSNSLHTKTIDCVDGTIPQSAFSEAIERIGGTVDLLKLDCEGAEWQLFTTPEPWEQVRSVTMEYHLWAKPGATTQLLFSMLADLGFDIDGHQSSPKATFGMLQASRRGL